MPFIIGWNTTKPLNTSTAVSNTNPPNLQQMVNYIFRATRITQFESEALTRLYIKQK